MILQELRDMHCFDVESRSRYPDTVEVIAERVTRRLFMC